jgi:hypothetical protein
MNLIATESSQVLHLFPMEEVRPLSGVHLPTLIQRITERYLFATRPNDIIEATKSGVKFSTGRLDTNGSQIAITQLDIYHDGLVVIARTTDDALAVMYDLMAWAKREFNFRDHITPPRTSFTSTVVVDFATSIEAAFQNFQTITGIMNAAHEAAYGTRLELNAARIAVMVDPLTLPPFTNTNFMIERRTGHPYRDNRYFCTAPLPTQVHLQMLEALEKTLTVHAH